MRAGRRAISIQTFLAIMDHATFPTPSNLRDRRDRGETMQFPLSKTHQKRLALRGIFAFKKKHAIANAFPLQCHIITRSHRQLRTPPRRAR